MFGHCRAYSTTHSGSSGRAVQRRTDLSSICPSSNWHHHSCHFWSCYLAMATCPCKHWLLTGRPCAERKVPWLLSWVSKMLLTPTLCALWECSLNLCQMAWCSEGDCSPRSHPKRTPTQQYDHCSWGYLCVYYEWCVRHSFIAKSRVRCWRREARTGSLSCSWRNCLLRALRRL